MLQQMQQVDWTTVLAAIGAGGLPAVYKYVARVRRALNAALQLLEAVQADLKKLHDALERIQPKEPK